MQDINFFSCCKQNFNGADDIKRHLLETHKVDVSGKASRRMVTHIDEKEFVHSCYQWNIDGVTFLQTLCSYR